MYMYTHIYIFTTSKKRKSDSGVVDLKKNVFWVILFYAYLYLLEASPQKKKNDPSKRSKSEPFTIFGSSKVLQEKLLRSFDAMWGILLFLFTLRFSFIRFTQKRAKENEILPLLRLVVKKTMHYLSPDPIFISIVYQFFVHVPESFILFIACTTSDIIIIIIII